MINIVCDIKIKLYLCTMKKLLIALVAAILTLPATAQNDRNMEKIYSLKALNNKGAEVDFSQYE